MWFSGCTAAAPEKVRVDLAVFPEAFAGAELDCPLRCFPAAERLRALKAGCRDAGGAEDRRAAGVKDRIAGPAPARPRQRGRPGRAAAWSGGRSLFGVVAPPLRLFYPVAPRAERPQVVEAVGLKVAGEQPERADVVDGHPRVFLPAPPAGVAVPRPRGPALPVPVRAAVLVVPAPPGWVVAPFHVEGHPRPGARGVTKVPPAGPVRVDQHGGLTLVAGHRHLAGRLLRLGFLPRAVTGARAEVMLALSQQVSLERVRRAAV
jgi:uncharacterized Zn-finger protein